MAFIVDTNYMLLKVGALNVTGFADGEAFSHDFRDDDFDAVSGSHGTVTVVRKHNNISTVKWRVMQGNPVNAILTALHNASVLAGGSPLSFLFKDLKGDRVVSGRQMLFKKHPQFAYGDSANPVEWEGMVFHPTIIGGGSPLIA